MLGSPLRTVAFARRSVVSGATDPGPHYFELDASRVPPAWNGAYGVIEGDGPTVQVASRSLITGLERGGPAGVVWSGDEERYLASILRETSRGREGFSAVIVVAVGGEIIVAAIRGGQAYLCSDDGCDAVLSEGDDRGLRVERASVGRGRVLVLGTVALARHVRADEVRRTLAAYDDLESPAEWLVRLGSQRGSQPATVAMVEFAGVPLPARLLARATQTHNQPARGEPVVVAERVTRPIRPRRLRRKRLIAESCLLAVALAGAAVYLAPRIQKDFTATRAAVPPLLAPTALQSRQISGMDVQLAWRPVSRATRYAIIVGRHHYVSTSPNLTLHDDLRTGITYRWWVTAQHGPQRSPLSASGSLFIRPVPATQWRFAGYQQSPDRVVLTLANPGTTPVNASVLQVAAQHVSQTFVIPAQGSLPIVLPLAAGLSVGTPIQISADAPILPQRTVTRGTIVHTQYGTPGLTP